MECKKCGNEKFEVVKVFRNIRIDLKGKHLYSKYHDTRKVLCTECLTVYYTETSLKYIKIYNSTTLKANYFETSQINLF